MPSQIWRFPVKAERSFFVSVPEGSEVLSFSSTSRFPTATEKSKSGCSSCYRQGLISVRKRLALCT